MVALINNVGQQFDRMLDDKTMTTLGLLSFARGDVGLERKFSVRDQLLSYTHSSQGSPIGDAASKPLGELGGEYMNDGVVWALIGVYIAVALYAISYVPVWLAPNRA